MIVKLNVSIIWLVAIIVTVHVSLLIYSGVITSPTNGEVPALSAGIYHWATGKFDLFRVNPPLVRGIAALPVLAFCPKTDWSTHHDILAARDEFPIGIKFIEINGEKSFTYFTIARIACIPFSVLGAITCFLWAKELFGTKSGFCALLLWCFSPTILGHAATIGPDLPSAACGVFACYQLWHWLQKPTWGQVTFTGVALGIAELSKTTWITLFPLWGIMACIWFFRNKHTSTKSVSKIALQYFAICFIGLSVLNLGYGFERFGTPLGDFRFVSHSLGGK
ncbi:MAG: ArnT family glycosyltransferase, partial [Thermoguttaceae bacterium]